MERHTSTLPEINDVDGPLSAPFAGRAPEGHFSPILRLPGRRAGFALPFLARRARSLRFSTQAGSCEKLVKPQNEIPVVEPCERAVPEAVTNKVTAIVGNGHGFQRAK